MAYPLHDGSSTHTTNMAVASSSTASSASASASASTSASASSATAAQETLTAFFHAMNTYNVQQVLDCFSPDIEAFYLDPGRNWKGMERGTIVVTAIVGQLAHQHLQVSFRIVEESSSSTKDDDNNNNNNNTTTSSITTEEDWSHSNKTIRFKCRYTFCTDEEKNRNGTKIRSIHS
jgi:hypothetical protein